MLMLLCLSVYTPTQLRFRGLSIVVLEPYDCPECYVPATTLFLLILLGDCGECGTVHSESSRCSSFPPD